MKFQRIRRLLITSVILVKLSLRKIVMKKEKKSE